MLRTVIIAMGLGLIFVSAYPLEDSKEMVDLSELDLSSMHNFSHNYHGNRSASWKHKSKANSQPQRQLNDLECGVAIVNHELRIYFGRVAKEGEFPWLVSVYSSGGKCGGTIITKEFILTSAHCVFPDREVVVTTGVLGNYREAGARAFLHPFFSNDTGDNDIALLKLFTPLEWDNYVRPICLPDSNEQIPIGTMLRMTGRGRAEDSPNILFERTADLPVVDMNVCTYVSQPDFKICVGEEDPNDRYQSSSCLGDSGGPVSMRRADRKNQWILVGVINEGRGCRGPNLFVRVGSYLGWINHSIKSI